VSLRSERLGRHRGLSDRDFRTALFEVLSDLDERDDLFIHAFGDSLTGPRSGGAISNPERWCRENLKDSELWFFVERPSRVLHWGPDWEGAPKLRVWKQDVLVDLVELLHRDAVYFYPDDAQGPEDADQRKGQEIFRNRVNPVLSQLAPRLILTPAGEVVELAVAPKTPIDEVIVRRPVRGGHIHEAALEDTVFDHVLGVLAGVGRSMERAPATYLGMDEESRRDVLAMTLNSHYVGKVASEAFNVTGKTDILVRVEDKNVFIAECKVWRGAAGYPATVRQLFRYAAWRDTKLAVILFIPNVALSKVRSKAIEATEQLPEFIEWTDAKGDPIGARVHWPGDPEQIVNLAILLIHLPPT
jgi:hypothetical protein